LSEHFAINMSRELELELFSGFSKRAQETLLDYAWPGNIRELKNVVERAVYRTPPNVPVHDIVLDPFESKYRPKQRIKTGLVNSTISVPSEPNTVIPQEPQDLSDEAPSVAANQSEAFSFPLDLKQASQDYEINMLKQALEDSQYNQKKTAEKLSLTYHQLRGYLKKYNLLENTESA
jgi:psp operon transcriptional activator